MSLLADFPFWAIFILTILTASFLAYKNVRLWIWTLTAAIFLLLLGASTLMWIVFLILALLFNLKTLRVRLVSSPVMNLLNSMKILPAISPSERIALEAGTTWIETEFFSGKPDFRKILKETYPELSKEEKSFLEGPAEKLCRMTNDWQISRDKDLPAETWDFLKKEKFFGMVIPEEFGGLGFSAHAMNTIVAKLSSRSIALAVDVMVPNSLGPAELLIHYGTEEQKNHYLPRLATGEEIPCFALTEPQAGSDATALSSTGVVFKGEDGELYIKLNWNKRYITLSAVSTVLGLAFVLKDPDNLLKKGEEPGITCGLIPTNTKGVVLGKRHDPLGIPFINSPTEGHDVVIPVSQIIGGAAQAGNGWKMLMETLSGGRGIFLPAMNTGGSKLVARVAGAYARVRQQFGISIGKFEGIEELLAPIGGYTYILDALSRFTTGALDKGKKPAVISAIAKYSGSEFNRRVINNGMDILGGAGIIMGPRNLLAHQYISAPIGITVEGSNIVTRSLIIFGQGLIRAHPYAFKIMESLTNKNAEDFDSNLWGHFKMVIRNFSRCTFLFLSRGMLVKPPVSGPAAHYYRKLSWASASFSLLADTALFSLGGNLKIKEKISGRFADILIWLYLCTCVLRKFEAEGNKKDDLPFVDWALQQGLSNIQQSFDDLYKNFPVPVLDRIFSGPVSFLSRINPIGNKPSDKTGAMISDLLQSNGIARESLTNNIYLPENKEEPLNVLETAFLLAIEAEPSVKKIKGAIKKKKLKKDRIENLIEDALEKKIINKDERNLLKKAEEAAAEAIKVDSFGPDILPSTLLSK